MCSATTFAAENHATISDQGSVGIKVYGKYVYLPPEGEYRNEKDDEKHEIETKDGIVIHVNPENTDEKLTLVITIIDETHEEAFGWFQGTMKEHGSKIYPFDFHFENEAGEKVMPDGVIEVTMTIPKGFENASVYAVAPDGSTELLKFVKNDGQITFWTETDYYYVLVDQSEGLESPEKPENVASKTGDQSRVWLWAGLMLVAGIGIAGVLKRRNKV